MSRHRIRPNPLTAFCLFSFFVFFQHFVAPEAGAVSYWRDSSIGAKRYTLYGTIDLTYDREWTEDSNAEAVNTFTQTYELGVRGFVVDPRIVNFDVAGSYTNNSSNIGTDFTLQGVRLNVIILEELPRTAGSKFLKYLPNPIRLRFTDYSNAYDYRNYGVSLQYTVPEEVLFYRKKDETGRSNLHVPILYFDYDNYKSGSGNNRISTDIYSFRASMTGEHYDHRLLYEVQNQTGSIAYKREAFELIPVYRFYNEQTRRSIDVFSSLRFEKIEDTKYLTIQVLPRYYEPMGPAGKDLRQLTGNFYYTKTTFPDSSKIESYTTALAASYTKAISPQVTNMSILSVGIGKNNDDELHFERLSDSIQADLSRNLGASATVTLGNTQSGGEYGAEGFLYTKTRVRTSAGYSFSSVPDPDNRTVSHRFYLTAAGPILRTASFDATAQYIIRDVSGTGSPFEENLFYAGANIYGYIGSTSVTLGGSFAHTLNRTDHENTSSFLFLYGNASRYITPRTFLNLYATWEQDNNDVKRFELRPSINWRRGMTLLDVEYDYIWTYSPVTSDSIRDHRLMVRLVRDLFFTIYQPQP